MVNKLEGIPYLVLRGVRQGDPISCFLFNLAIEPLAESLRCSDLHGIKIPGTAESLVCKLFADDTALYLSHCNCWSDVMAIADIWCLASTAKFNDSKTEIVPLGPVHHCKAVSPRVGKRREHPLPQRRSSPRGGPYSQGW